MAGVLTALAGVLPSGGGPPPPSYLIDQNFETPGTGYDNGETWNSFAGGGTIDPVYSAAPIVGTQSLNIITTGSNQAAAYTDFTSSDNIYFQFRFRLASFTGASDLFAIYTSGVALIGYIVVLGTGEMNLVSAAGGANNTSTAIPTATDLWLWFEYEKGTGANGVLRAGWSTTSTKPTLSASGTTTCALTATGNTTQAGRVYLGTVGSSTLNAVYDQILADNTAPIP